MTIDARSSRARNSPARGFRCGRRRAGVLIFPTVMGVSDLERDFAGRLNSAGYGAMVADLFGTATRGADPRRDVRRRWAACKGDRGGAARPKAPALLDNVRRPSRPVADRRHRLLLRRLVRARSRALRRGYRGGGQLPRPVRPAGSAAADRSRPRSLADAWLGRSDGPARRGRRARQGTDRRRAPTGRSTPTATSAMASPTPTPTRSEIDGVAVPAKRRRGGAGRALTQFPRRAACVDGLRRVAAGDERGGDRQAADERELKRIGEACGFAQRAHLHRQRQSAVRPATSAKRK